jgi:hypothetical protein
MHNLADEEAPVAPIIVSDSDLPTKRERPGLQQEGGSASLSARAMHNLADEESPARPIKVSDSDLPTKRKRPGLQQKGGSASLSARAMHNLADEEAPARPRIVSDSDLLTKRERPGLQKGGFASLSAQAMISLAKKASVAVGESSPKQSRPRLISQKGSFASLSTQAMHSLAGEAEETMEAAAQKVRRPSIMGGRSSLSALNAMAAITNNIAIEASQQSPLASSVSASKIKSNEEPHRSSSLITSLLPISKESPQTSVPKPSARSSWSPTQALNFLSGEVRIPAQPAQTNAHAPPQPPFGSNDDDLQSVDLNGSSHHKNRHAEVPHAPSSGGLVGTLRRVSLLFSHDIQLELEAANRTQAAASALLDEALTTDVFSHDIELELDAANTTQAVGSALLDEALTTDAISLFYDSEGSLESVPMRTDVSSLFHESEGSLDSVPEEEEEAEAENMLHSSSLIATKRDHHTRDEAAQQNSASSEENAHEGSTGEADTPKEEELSSVPVPTSEDTTPKTQGGRRRTVS